MRIILPLAMLLCLVAGVYAAAPLDIVINEVMYNPAGSPEAEWLELYNRSASPITLSSTWILSDSAADLHFWGQTIAAGGFLTIAVSQPSGTSFSFTPDVMAIDSGIVLGNSGDYVILKEGTTVIDSLKYANTWGDGRHNNLGGSLERITYDGGTMDPLNWSGSIPDGGTPGAVNSIYSAGGIPPQITGLSHSPGIPTSTDQVAVSCRVRTRVALTTVDLLTSIAGGPYLATAMYDDGAHGDGSAGDSVWGFFLVPMSDGTVVNCYVIAQAGSLTDYSDTNTFTVSNSTGTPESDIIINEINYNNAGTDTEWVELLNIGTSLMDISGWTMVDVTGPSFVFPAATMMAPGAYLVVCADTHAVTARYGITNVIGNFTFTLNNSGVDKVVLRAGDSSLKDSVSYGTSGPWPGVTPNRTIEVINATQGNADYRNWQSSYVLGGTPGRANSLATVVDELRRNRASESLVPNPTLGPVHLGRIAAGELIDVRSISGEALGTLRADEAGSVDLSRLEGVNAGCYILSSGQQTIGRVIFLGR